MFLGCTSTGRVDLCFLWFYVQEHPKAQLVVVLVLKRLRRRGNGLKSHPTDWEKPWIEPATPGLQDIGLSPITKKVKCIPELSIFTVFLKNRNIISKMKRSKVTDYAAWILFNCVPFQRKEFALRGSEFIPSRAVSYKVENHFYHIRVASLECYYFYYARA